MIREAQRLLEELSSKTNGLRVGVPLIVLMTLGYGNTAHATFYAGCFFHL